MSFKDIFQSSDQTITKDDVEIDKPRMFKVILHNDDYTPMDFVVSVLVTIFHKNHAESTQIMLNVHNKGKGICGVYTFGIAETKVHQVHEIAGQNGYPLKASLEEA